MKNSSTFLQKYSKLLVVSYSCQLRRNQATKQQATCITEENSRPKNERESRYGEIIARAVPTTVEE
jgi:hypothetical protein